MSQARSPVSHGGDLLDGDALVVGVGLQRVARAVVDGGDAERAEKRATSVQPYLGFASAADRREELLRERGIEAGARAVGPVDDGDLVVAEQLVHVLDRLVASCGSARSGS